MFNFFRDEVKIEEYTNEYLIKGVNLKYLERDFRNVFKTSVIYNLIIKKKSSNSFLLSKFFTVELNWLLENLVNEQPARVTARYHNGLRKYSLLLQEIRNNTWIKSTLENHPNFNLNKALTNFTFTPTNDQRDFLENYANVKYSYQLKGCLLDAAVGSGKSVTSLFWSKMINDNPTIIIVPKNLITDPWLDHLTPQGSRYCFKNPPKVWTSTSGLSPLNQKCDYYIFYKEQMRKDNFNGIPFKEILENISQKGVKPVKVIVDESHNYNDPFSQQTQGLIDFCSNNLVSDVLEQTGTPIKAQGKETYPLFCIIDKYFTPEVRKLFLKMYGRDNTYLNELLAHRLGRIRFVIKTIQGMENPPEPVIIPVKFDGVENFTLKNIRLKMMDYITERVEFYRENMQNYKYDFNQYLSQYENSLTTDSEREELKRYREIVKHFQMNGYNNFTDSHLSKECKLLEDKLESKLKGKDLAYFRHIKSAVKYVGLKIRGEALGNVLGKARSDAVRLAIEHAGLPSLIDSVKAKTAIYTSYIDAVKYAEEYLSKNGFNPISLFSENSDDVDEVLNALKNIKTVNPLITTFNTLREGKPLLMCNQLILLNSPWRSFELTQVIARIYRRGQTEECFVWLLDLDTGSEENITSRSIDIMEWSKEQVEQLLGGGVLGAIKNSGINFAVKGMAVTMQDLTGFEHYSDTYRPSKVNNDFVNIFRR